jgi:hypothetical protein
MRSDPMRKVAVITPRALSIMGYVNIRSVRPSASTNADLEPFASALEDLNVYGRQ